MTEQKIEPCPECKGIDTELHLTPSTVAHLSCMGCRYMGPITEPMEFNNRAGNITDEDLHKEAVKWWNESAIQVREQA